MVGVTVHVTSPSRSRLRKVKVSIRCEMPSTTRLISLKRFGPWPSSTTISTLHLSPTSDKTSRTLRQLSCVWIRGWSVTWMFLRYTACDQGFKNVPSCGGALVSYPYSVTNRNRVYHEDSSHRLQHPRPLFGQPGGLGRDRGAADRERHARRGRLSRSRPGRPAASDDRAAADRSSAGGDGRPARRRGAGDPGREPADARRVPGGRSGRA